MKKILIIPTTDWLRDIPFRMKFISKELMKRYELHVLGLSIYSNIKSRTIQDNGIVIHYPQFKHESPLSEHIFYALYKEMLVKFSLKLIKEYNIDAILVSNPIVFTKDFKKYSHVIFDVADYYPEFIRRYFWAALKYKPLNYVENIIDYYFIKNILNESDIVVFSNNILEKYYKNVLSERIVIPNGYDNNIFNLSYIRTSKNKNIKEIKSAKDESFILTFIGTFEYWIDIDGLFYIYRTIKELLHKESLETLLLVAGTGPLLKKFMNKISPHDSVKFLGKIEYNMVPYLIYRSNIMIIPFKYCKTSLLSFPLKALEALALQRKIIYMNVPSLKIFKNSYEINMKKNENNNIVKFILSNFNKKDNYILKKLTWQEISRKYVKIIDNLK